MSQTAVPIGFQYSIFDSRNEVRIARTRHRDDWSLLGKYVELVWCRDYLLDENYPLDHRSLRVAIWKDWDHDISGA